jgi:hypothetical protein
VDDLSFDSRVGIGASVCLSNANRNQAIARALKDPQNDAGSAPEVR